LCDEYPITQGYIILIGGDLSKNSMDPNFILSNLEDNDMTTRASNRRTAVRSDDVPSNLHELLCIVQKQEEFKKQTAAENNNEDSSSAGRQKRSSSAKAPDKFKFVDHDISKFSEKYDDYDIRDHFAALTRHHRRTSCKKADQKKIDEVASNLRGRSKSLGKLRISGHASDVISQAAPVPVQILTKTAADVGLQDELDVDTLQKEIDELNRQIKSVFEFELESNPNASKRSRKSKFMLERQVEITESIFSPREEHMGIDHDAIAIEKENLPMHDDSAAQSEDPIDMDSNDLEIDEFNESGKYGKLANQIAQ
jgi:hypothetical protein